MIASNANVFFFYFPCQNEIFIFHHVFLPRSTCVGSQVFQAWRKFMDEIEQQSKQIRYNAEQLENLCSDRMAQLYQDKRKSKKQYQEEHAKIASQFAHVSYKLLDLRVPRDASTSSTKRSVNSMEMPKRREKNFESESASLFIWSRRWSMNRHPRAASTGKIKISPEDDAAYLIYISSDLTHVSRFLFYLKFSFYFLWKQVNKNFTITFHFGCDLRGIRQMLINFLSKSLVEFQSLLKKLIGFSRQKCCHYY